MKHFLFFVKAMERSYCSAMLVKKFLDISLAYLVFFRLSRRVLAWETENLNIKLRKNRSGLQIHVELFFSYVYLPFPVYLDPPSVLLHINIFNRDGNISNYIIILVQSPKMFLLQL
jgi:hypothetical protein